MSNVPDRGDAGDQAGEVSSAPTSTGAPSLRPAGEHAGLTPGAILASRFRIVSLLGRGGMGEVYRAEDLKLGQPVALKFLPGPIDATRLERFYAEVRLGRQVAHPNVCRIYDVIEADGRHFLVMEYVDGEDLSSLLRRIGRLPQDKATEIARGLCAGLAAAHEKGILHRDLKPANVMIDGCGHARLTDFGLAALAGEAHHDARAGTPAYMAPEQLRGEVLSVRSDLYSLGLVFYEIFTGRRAWDAGSVSELLKLRSDSSPATPSSLVKDIDPAIERLILRCLERDPAARPATANALLAAFPGGDPLEAAIALGETPSPEMVAAASVVGDLRPAVAWVCLIAGLLGLLSITMLGGRVMLFRQVSLPKPPEALADRAKDLLSRLGYGEGAVDSAHAFITDPAFIEHVLQQHPLSARWEKLRTARPGPLLFYYRESRSPLVSTSWSPTVPWEGPIQFGRVLRADPPLTVPGMTRVVLDRNGRLTSFVAVPPLFDPDPGPGPNPDWSTALAEAGFDPARVKPSGSHWAAPVDSDRRAAWDGAIQGQPDVTFHIEAAAYRGRLVYFQMRGPWVEPPRIAVAPPAPVALVVMLVFCVVLIPVAGVWVRRNLRLGRGDRKGAQRLAIFTGVTATLAQLVRVNHTALPQAEFTLLVQIAGQSLFAASLIWLLYLALEPAVRRRWPHTLISWSRLLTGRFRDPLLGRDMLVGALAGMALALAPPFNVAGSLLGQAPVLAGDMSALSAPRHLAHFFFLSPCMAVLNSLSFLFILCLFQALFRRTWLAQLLLFLVFWGVAVAQGNDPLVAFLQSAILAGIIVLVLVRVGLLASTIVLFTSTVLVRTPLTLDWSAWYAGRSFAVLGFFAALLLFAFHTSLGGKPLFGKVLVED